MTVYWPEALRPQKIKVDISHRNLRGPTAQSGFTQVVSNSAGIWVATYDSIPVYKSSMVRMWRALDSEIGGQRETISLPIWDYPRAPGANDELGSNLLGFGNLPHSDETLFDDNTGYQTAYTNVNVSAAASVGATTVSLTKVSKTLLEPGHRFSVNDRLYQIKRVTSQTNTAATVIVTPPLREALKVGDRAEFDYPRVLMRLTDDKAMQLDLNYNGYATPTLTFFEAL